MAVTVVFDTNILFSATGWRGQPFQCVELARTGKLQAASCTHIMDELSEKLVAKLRFSSEQAAETLADYLGFMPLVNIAGDLRAVPRDPEDNAVLECAVVAQARFIITGDLDLLSLGTFRGIEIIRAAEFMRRWQAGGIRE
jgi:putative PIN family toxin of toxin-antitoxin system